MRDVPMTGVEEAILKRYSVREFLPDPVTPDQVAALLEAARLAPSSLNSQPWRFKVVQDEENLVWFGTKPVSRSQTWLSKAGAIFVCCADLTGYVRDSQASAFFYREHDLIRGDSMDGIEEYVEREVHASETARFGAAAMNVGFAASFMMLRAVEIGLGSCWIGMFNETNIKAHLGIDPSLRVVGLLAVGHPASDTPSVRKRKELDEIILR